MYFICFVYAAKVASRKNLGDHLNEVCQDRNKMKSVAWYGWTLFSMCVCVCFPLGLEIWYLKRQLDMIQGFGRLCGSLSRPRPWEKECAVSCAYDFVVRILASTSLLRLLLQVKEWVSFGCSLMKRLFCDICISVVRCLGR